jgi:DNA-binding response OmpR family regulator
MTESAIILVESDLAVCDAFQAFAQSVGHVFLQYASLERAIENAVPGATDILVADLSRLEDVLPFLDWRNALPVPPRTLILTAHSPATLARRIGAVAGVDILTKPLAAADLLAALESQGGAGE